MSMIHLIEGPVGSGKSTIASKLSLQLRAPRLILDKWMTKLFSPDRPSTNFIQWYIERKDRCIDQIWDVATEMLRYDTNVILELGLIQQSLREEFYDKVENSKFNMKIYVINAQKDLRKERVLQRNMEKGETYSAEIPENIFEMANSMWEPIDEAECRDFEIVYIATD